MKMGVVRPELIVAILVGGDWLSVERGSFRAGAFVISDEEVEEADYIDGFEADLAGTPYGRSEKISAPLSSLLAVRTYEEEPKTIEGYDPE